MSISGFIIECWVTSLTRSPLMKTSRPSRMESRYWLLVRIMTITFIDDQILDYARFIALFQILHADRVQPRVRCGTIRGSTQARGHTHAGDTRSSRAPGA